MELYIDRLTKQYKNRSPLTAFPSDWGAASTVFWAPTRREDHTYADDLRDLKTRQRDCLL